MTPRFEHVRVALATAATPGAVALLQLTGGDVLGVLHALTGERDWPLGRLRLRNFARIDEGLAVRLRPDWAQLMPHGGPRVVRELLDHLASLGVAYDPQPDARATYPEASSRIEADMLAAMAAAASPAAVDLLAAQPGLWRTSYSSNRLGGARDLDRLLVPPTVVVVGRPNVGKSTLTNAMLGRAASIVADLPGTTRDWVAGLAELVPPAGPGHAVGVRWVDTPGLRDTGDSIEREAIALARHVLAAADVLIAMRDPQLDWPDVVELPKPPDVYVVNKVDTAGEHFASGDGATPEAPLAISAAADRGLDALAARVIGALGLSALDPPPLWPFSPTLRAFVRGEPVDLAAYLAR